MGIGTGTGDNRAVDAATNAINNPLLEDSQIEGANHILINITGNDEMTLLEVEEIVKIVTANADPDALIIYGTTTDSTLGESISVTVIATGFISSKYRRTSDRQVVSVASEKAQKAESGDFVTGTEWKLWNERTQKSSQGLGTRNASSSPVSVSVPAATDDLDTPTVVRLQQKVQN